MILLSGFATSLAISVGITPLVRFLSNRFKVLDQPDLLKGGRRMHNIPTPRLGGVAIVTGFLIPCFLIFDNESLRTISMASLAIFALGFLDDLVSLSARIRIVIQTVISGIAVSLLGLEVQEIYFFQDLSIQLSPVVGLSLSIFIIVGAINSLNMIDGLDGLASGVSFIAIMMLAYNYYLITGDIENIAVVALPLLGAILGFLRYNTHPASIFMGDSGSNWLGFMVGLLMLINLCPQQISGGAKITATPLIMSTILCFGVAVFDTFIVIVSRVRTGHSPLVSDKRHFHHSLVKIGLNQSQSVICIYFLSFCSAIAGSIPAVYHKLDLYWVPYVWSLLLAAIISLSVFINSDRLQSLINFRQIISSRIMLSKPTYALVRSWEKLNKYLLFIILIASPITAGRFDQVIGQLSIIALALVLVAALTSRIRHQSDFFCSIANCLAFVTLLIANNQQPLKVGLFGEAYNIQFIYNGLFVVLAISTLGLILCTIKRKYLIFSPSDFLMLLLPMIILLLPETVINEYRLDIISLRSIVVFVAYKSLEKMRRSNHRHLRLALSCALLYVLAVSLVGFEFIY